MVNERNQAYRLILKPFKAVIENPSEYPVLIFGRALTLVTGRDSGQAFHFTACSLLSFTQTETA